MDSFKQDDKIRFLSLSRFCDVWVLFSIVRFIFNTASYFCFCLLFDFLRVPNVVFCQFVVSGCTIMSSLEIQQFQCIMCSAVLRSSILVSARFFFMWKIPRAVVEAYAGRLWKNVGGSDDANMQGLCMTKSRLASFCCYGNC